MIPTLRLSKRRRIHRRFPSFHFQLFWRATHNDWIPERPLALKMTWSCTSRNPTHAASIIISPKAHPSPDVISQASLLKTPPAFPSAALLSPRILRQRPLWENSPSDVSLTLLDNMERTAHPQPNEFALPTQRQAPHRRSLLARTCVRRNREPYDGRCRKARCITAIIEWRPIARASSTRCPDTDSGRITVSI